MSGPSVEKRLPVQHLPAINFALLLYRQREMEQELFPDAEAADQIKGTYASLVQGGYAGSASLDEMETMVTMFPETVTNLYVVLTWAAEEVEHPEARALFLDAAHYLKRHYGDDIEAA